MGTGGEIKKIGNPVRPVLRRPSGWRMARIDKQLQREISLLLEQRVKNDAARSAIVTGVQCSRDLELARVYFTTLDPARRDPVLTELRNVKGALRSMLGQVLKLRHIPDLEFVIDRSLDYGERIDGILRSLGLDAVNAEGESEEEFEEESEEESEEVKRNDSDDNENEDNGEDGTGERGPGF
ncbi:MAG: 30S ribosome-binding factor RbfA [Synergistaceae bacterium]|nr:30S ribosome-binding factor RbfA [Synergistaceae bacterium]